MDRLLSRRFIGSPDAFKMVLEYGTAPYIALELAWTSDDGVDAVVERFLQQRSALMQQHQEPRIELSYSLVPPSHPPSAAPHPPSSPDRPLRVRLQLASSVPPLRALQVLRTSASGTVPDALLAALLRCCDLSSVTKIKCCEAASSWWSSCAAPSAWQAVRQLTLSYCGLATLPAAALGQLRTLRVLRLSHNKLVALPGELGQLAALEVLAADHNLLASIPVELRQCRALRELNLEGNRLATPVLDLRLMQSSLQSLQLFGNPLEYMPELSPCTALRSLSLANVRIMADATYTRWEVEVAALPYMARGHKLAPLFRLTFRRSSLHHPLLAGALGRIAEEPESCKLIAKEEVAVQQLLLMALSDNGVVRAGLLAACSSATVAKLVAHDVVSAVELLLSAASQESQQCGLTLLSALASASDAVSAQLMGPATASRLHRLICTGDPGVRQAALLSLSHLCFCATNKQAVRQAPGLLATLIQLAQLPPSSTTPAPTPAPSPLPQGSPRGGEQGAASEVDRRSSRHSHGEQAGPPSWPQDKEGEGGGEGGTAASSLGFVSDLTRRSALRVLAVLGENEEVRKALRLPGIEGRGVRVLALDGGGMKGLAMARMLRALEAAAQRPLHSLFDLVVGTSTGAIVAVALAVLGFNLDQVEDIYTKLGHKVFNQAAARRGDAEPSAASWGESLWRMYQSGSQHVRVAVYGCKHDPTAFEGLLMDMCNIKDKMGCISDQFIDASYLPDATKVAVVSTLTSCTPAAPFLFRSYELPEQAEGAAQAMGACAGSSRHLIWQGVRASSAAPYYLDDFAVGDERWQDGATTANNPTLVALQQARLLWPHLALDLVVSLGCGLTPLQRRERSVSQYLDTGNVLIESACSTERVHEALATLLPLVPGVKYYRFQPCDERFGMDLDEIKPEAWARLVAATDEYCLAHAARFEAAAADLVAPFCDVSSSDTTSSAASADDLEDGSEGVGESGASGETECVRKVEPEEVPGMYRLPPGRRGLLLLTSPRSPLRHQQGAGERVAAALAALPCLVHKADLQQGAVKGDPGWQAAGPAAHHHHHIHHTHPHHHQPHPQHHPQHQHQHQHQHQQPCLVQLPPPPAVTPPCPLHLVTHAALPPGDSLAQINSLHRPPNPQDWLPPPPSATDSSAWLAPHSPPLAMAAGAAGLPPLAVKRLRSRPPLDLQAGRTAVAVGREPLAQQPSPRHSPAAPAGSGGEARGPAASPLQQLGLDAPPGGTGQQQPLLVEGQEGGTPQASPASPPTAPSRASSPPVPRPPAAAPSPSPPSATSSASAFMTYFLPRWGAGAGGEGRSTGSSGGGTAPAPPGLASSPAANVQAAPPSAPPAPPLHDTSPAPAQPAPGLERPTAKGNPPSGPPLPSTLPPSSLTSALAAAAAAVGSVVSGSGLVAGGAGAAAAAGAVGRAGLGGGSGTRGNGDGAVGLGLGSGRAEGGGRGGGGGLAAMTVPEDQVLHRGSVPGSGGSSPPMQRTNTSIAARAQDKSQGQGQGQGQAEGQPGVRSKQGGLFSPPALASPYTFPSRSAPGRRLTDPLPASAALPGPSPCHPPLPLQEPLLPQTRSDTPSWQFQEQQQQGQVNGQQQGQVNGQQQQQGQGQGQGQQQQGQQQQGQTPEDAPLLPSPSPSPASLPLPVPVRQTTLNLSGAQQPQQPPSSPPNTDPRLPNPPSGTPQPPSPPSPSSPVPLTPPGLTHSFGSLLQLQSEPPSPQAPPCPAPAHRDDPNQMQEGERAHGQGQGQGQGARSHEDTAAVQAPRGAGAQGQAGREQPPGQVGGQEEDGCGAGGQGGGQAGGPQGPGPLPPGLVAHPELLVAAVLQDVLQRPDSGGVGVLHLGLEPASPGACPCSCHYPLSWGAPCSSSTGQATQGGDGQQHPQLAAPAHPSGAAWAGLGPGAEPSSCSCECGCLVAAWQEELVTLLEPSAQCSAFVQRLAGRAAAGRSLAQVTGGAPCFVAGPCLYALLARQDVITTSGQQVSSMLFDVTSPAALLAPSQLAQVQGVWQGLVVTAACPLPRALVEGLLRAGAAAVVSPPALVTGAGAPLLPHLVTTFVSGLAAGLGLEEALVGAEASCPLLHGCLEVVYL